MLISCLGLFEERTSLPRVGITQVYPQSEIRYPFVQQSHLDLVVAGQDSEDNPTAEIYLQNTTPNVSLVAPEDGTTVQLGREMRIEAEASDPDGNIQRVRFRAAGTVVGTDSTSSDGFSTTWTPSSPGTRSLTAKAVDDQGASSADTITVRVNAVPHVSLVAPRDGTTVQVGREVRIEAEASDADGNIQRVRFRAAGTVVGTDSTSSDGFSTTWTPSSPGIRALMAKAIDEVGAFSTDTAAVAVRAEELQTSIALR